MIENTARNAQPLEDARGQYIDELDRFRYQLNVRRGGPAHFEALGERATTYSDSFQNHLLDASSEPGTRLGKTTIGEIMTRRQQIADRFDTYPLRTYPETELIIGSIAMGSLSSGMAAGRIPSSIVSGLLVVTSYYSFKYRRAHHTIDDAIEDSRLVAHHLKNLEASEAATSENCMLVFDATLHSEEASVAKMATQLLKARTYTPLGFVRSAAYNFHEKRRVAKATKRRGTTD